MSRQFRIPFFSRAAVAADVDAEIAAHLDERVERLMAGGMTAAEARRVAVERFGDVETTRRAMRTSARRHASRVRRRDRFTALAQDARYTARQLRRAPGLSIAIIIMLGLGIGATAAMFGIIDRLLLRPPPHVRDADRLGRLYVSRVDDDNNRAVDQDEVSYLRYTQLRDGARGVAGVAAFGDATMIVGRPGASSVSRARVGFASANFWPVVGVHPALGRVFTAAEEETPDGAGVVVLGNTYWRSAWGADSSIVGRQIDVGVRRFTIIGVMPPDFNGVRPGRIDVWLPATAIRAREPGFPENWRAKNHFIWLMLVARLAPDATPLRAETVLTAAYLRANLGGRINDTMVRERARVAFGPLLEERGPGRQESTRVAMWLVVVAAIVLLIACSNVANLLLARAIRRRREIAIRVALGVSRSRLFAQLLVEGLLLASAGALLGVTIAFVGGRAMSAFFLPTVPVGDRIFDGRVLAFAVALALIAALLASLAPAVFAVRQDVSAMIKSGGRGETARGIRLRTLLLVGQCALSTALLLGAGWFIRSLQAARATRMGYDARSLIVVRGDRRDRTPLPGGMSAVYRQFAERLREVPGVVRAATTNQVPFSISSSTYLAVPGIDSATLEKLGTMRMNPVGVDYFETMGTRILRGRALDASDGPTAERVVVVSDSMARAFWPGQDPLGKCMRIGDAKEPCSRVVGVAENIHQYELRAEPLLQYWFPESQNQGGNTGAYAVIVRVSGDPHALFASIRQALQPIAPPGTYISLGALGDTMDRVAQPWRFGAIVLGAFGALGLLIAAMGLHSALSYTVSQRSVELGVRMALGATPRAVLVRVVADGMRVTAIGVACGLVVALLGGRSIDAILFGVTTTDPIVLPLAVGTLCVIALMACVVPAWRAARTDPVQVLRAE